jgi:hypothetical protein
MEVTGWIGAQALDHALKGRKPFLPGERIET